MKRKLILILSSIVIIFLGIIIYNILSFPVKNTMADIKMAIEGRLGFGINVVNNFEIKNRHIVLFTTNKGGESGRAVYSKNKYLNKLRLDYVNHGNGLFMDDRIKTNEGYYLLIQVNNNYKDIQNMEYYFAGERKYTSISGEIFYDYFKTNKNQENLNIEREKIRFFDVNGSDITAEAWKKRQ